MDDLTSPLQIHYYQHLPFNCGLLVITVLARHLLPDCSVLYRFRKSACIINVVWALFRRELPWKDGPADSGRRGKVSRGD